MSEKLIGYVLLLLGIVFMFFTAFSAYQVFLNKQPPPQIFESKGIAIDLSSAMEQATGVKQMNDPTSVSPLRNELVEAEVINQLLNMIVYVFLLGFFLNVGFKLSNLGVNLLRPINVVIKDSSKVTEAVEKATSPTQAVKK